LKYCAYCDNDSALLAVGLFHNSFPFPSTRGILPIMYGVSLLKLPSHYNTSTTIVAKVEEFKTFKT